MCVCGTVHTVILTKTSKHMHPKLNQQLLQSIIRVTNTHTHTAVFYLPGSSRRWWYSVNFNTQILDILYGCELLSNSNQRLASACFTFLALGHCHRSQRKVVPHIQTTFVPACGRNSVFHSPRLYSSWLYMQVLFWSCVSISFCLWWVLWWHVHCLM